MRLCLYVCVCVCDFTSSATTGLETVCYEVEERKVGQLVAQYQANIDSYISSSSRGYSIHK